jgi:hypothetical protein
MGSAGQVGLRLHAAHIKLKATAIVSSLVVGVARMNSASVKVEAHTHVSPQN